MAHINFEVVEPFEATARAVWDEMTDWKAHEQWIPMTRVELEPGDPRAVGAVFTAWTGPRPVALKDRMRVAVLDWDDAEQAGRCEVTKLGPVLRGRAGFTISQRGDGCELRWLEDVTVAWIPGFLSPVIERLSAAGFRRGLRGLSRRLGSRSAAP